MQERGSRLLPVLTAFFYCALVALPVCSALFLLISVNFSPTRSVSVELMTITAVGVALGQFLIMALHAGMAYLLGARPLRVLIHILVMMPITGATYLVTAGLFILVYPLIGAAST
jgi:hypothetical protein